MRLYKVALGWGSWLLFAVPLAYSGGVEDSTFSGPNLAQAIKGDQEADDSQNAWDQSGDSDVLEENEAEDEEETGPSPRRPRRKNGAQRATGGARSRQISGSSAGGEEETPPTGNGKRVRRFHEVLDELLAEFGYDMKTGQIKGLTNISIRKVRVSQAIPKSYEDYIETLLKERLREQAQVKIISCIPCKTRVSSLVDGQLMISSPSTNVAKLDAAAISLGIDNFLDAVLVYHSTHMVLAIDIFDTKTKELVWAKTYNSETIKSRYQKLAVDYSQVTKSRPTDEYVPEFRYMLGIGGASIPNVSNARQDSTMLSFQMRAMEKFNNRKDEFGLIFGFLKTTSSLLNDYPTEGETTASSTETDNANISQTVKAKPFHSAMMLQAAYSHLFLGKVESYDRLRHGLHLAMGGLFTTGYLAPATKAGWDAYLGRRFVTTLGIHYVGSASIKIDKKTQTAPGGLGYDLIVSVNL